MFLSNTQWPCMIQDDLAIGPIKIKYLTQVWSSFSSHHFAEIHSTIIQTKHRKKWQNNGYSGTNTEVIGGSLSFLVVILIRVELTNLKQFWWLVCEMFLRNNSKHKFFHARSDIWSILHITYNHIGKIHLSRNAKYLSEMCLKKLGENECELLK